MMGLYVEGELFWFDFPHTLESEDMLLARLEREALQEDSEKGQNVRARRRMRCIMRMQRELAGSAGKAAQAFSELGQAIGQAFLLPPTVRGPDLDLDIEMEPGRIERETDTPLQKRFLDLLHKGE